MFTKYFLDDEYFLRPQPFWYMLFMVPPLGLPWDLNRCCNWLYPKDKRTKWLLRWKSIDLLLNNSKMCATSHFLTTTPPTSTTLSCQPTYEGVPGVFFLISKFEFLPIFFLLGCWIYFMTLTTNDELGSWFHPWPWSWIVYIFHQAGGILDYFVVNLV